MDILDQSLSNVTPRTKWDIDDELRFWGRTWRVTSMNPNADTLRIVDERGHSYTFARNFLEVVRNGHLL